MSLRVRKSFKVAPGVRVNVSKSSVGVSAGVKGARVSVNSKGRVTTTAGIPGTGISSVNTYSASSGNKRSKVAPRAVQPTGASPVSIPHNTHVIPVVTNPAGKRNYIWYESGDLAPLFQIASEDTIIFDTETTGFDNENGRDEILQLSIIDGNGTVLFDSLLKPEHRRSWPKATEINGITPKMVKDQPRFEEVYNQVQDIFDRARLIVGYNTEFDLKFLEYEDIKVRKDALIVDVMKEFAPVHGVYNEYYGNYRWCKLSVCARKYKYRFNAHDSLEDAKATRHCFYSMLRDPDYLEVVRPYREALERHRFEVKRQEALRQAERARIEEEKRRAAEAEERRRAKAEEAALIRQAKAEARAEAIENKKAERMEKAIEKGIAREARRKAKDAAREARRTEKAAASQDGPSLLVRIIRVLLLITGILWTGFCVLGILFGATSSDRIFFICAGLFGVLLIWLGRGRTFKRSRTS